MTKILWTACLWISVMAVSIATGDDSTGCDDAELIRSTYQQMSELAKVGQWEKAAELMTAQARDETCAQMVVQAIGLRDSKLPMSIPNIEEAQDQVESVLADYGLDRLDIKLQMFHFSGEPNNDDAKNRQEQAERNLATAKQGLEKIENRWALVSELQKATAALPFGHSPFVTGEIVDIQLNGDVAEVKIKPGPPGQSNNGGVQIQVVSPPRVINYQKVDGIWLYTGLNREKTEAAMQEFEKSMPDRSDF